MKQDTWSERIRHAGSRVGQIEKEYENKIREHPYRATAIALGIGAVTGAAAVALMRKRHAS